MIAKRVNGLFKLKSFHSLLILHLQSYCRALNIWNMKKKEKK